MPQSIKFYWLLTGFLVFVLLVAVIETYAPGTIIKWQ